MSTQTCHSQPCACTFVPHTAESRACLSLQPNIISKGRSSHLPEHIIMGIRAAGSFLAWLQLPVRLGIPKIEHHSVLCLRHQLPKRYEFCNLASWKGTAMGCGNAQGGHDHDCSAARPGSPYAFCCCHSPFLSDAQYMGQSCPIQSINILIGKTWVQTYLKFSIHPVQHCFCFI